MYLPRTIQNEIPNLNEHFKVILISGMRQVGKSTVLLQMSTDSRNYVTLDDYEAMEVAEHAPKSFFRQYPKPLIIDEIQREPMLFRQIKLEVDRSSDYGLIWLSGSQRFSLMQNVGDSLAGRIFEIHLMPLSVYEREGKGLQQIPYLPTSNPSTNLSTKSVEDTWKIIWQGAWPRLINLSPKDRSQFFQSFITTFLERDIRTLGNVDRLTAFRKFMYACAIRTGQELRLNKLAEIAGVTEITVKRWLSIAEASGLIYFLPPFSACPTKTLTKSPKLYFTDTGLAAYLCGFSTPKQLHSDSNSGAFFETFVVTEILKSWRHNGIEPQLYFFRDAKTQAEIDLLIHHDGKYYPIEIKTSENPNISMLKHFSVLEKLNISVGYGAVICNIQESRFLTDSVIAHSIWQI